MKITATLTGVQEVLRNLDTEDARVRQDIEEGLKLAGGLLQRLSMEIVPIDTGNLRGSAFTRAQGSGLLCVVSVGYTAAYAIYVHENLDAAHGEAYNEKYAEQIERGDKGYHSRGEGQQAKFLEAPARLHLEELAQVIIDQVQRN